VLFLPFRRLHKTSFIDFVGNFLFVVADYA